MAVSAESVTSFIHSPASHGLASLLDTEIHYGEIVGTSPALMAALHNVEAVARTSATALILGESGVGKELIARAIHKSSDRSSKPLVKVNCASIPKELFESEFFGHVKGSFTGAHRDRAGRFELANGGTLFLDEVAEIPLELQAKLLRVLQEGQYERIGDERTRTTDVRVVAATNRHLQQAVLDGSFREDLYYRLSVFPIEVPSLRERAQDIGPLAKHFLSLACDRFGYPPPELTTGDLAVLQEYDWPGNIRELRNLIERAVILSRSDGLRIREAMPRSRPRNNSAIVEFAQNGFVKEADWQRSYRDNIVAALDSCEWRISGNGGAADLLGINASTLRGRMKSLAIPMPREKS